MLVDSSGSRKPLAEPYRDAIALPALGPSPSLEASSRGSAKAVPSSCASSVSCASCSRRSGWRRHSRCRCDAGAGCARSSRLLRSGPRVGCERPARVRTAPPARGRRGAIRSSPASRPPSPARPAASGSRAVDEQVARDSSPDLSVTLSIETRFSGLRVDIDNLPSIAPHPALRRPAAQELGIEAGVEMIGIGVGRADRARVLIGKLERVGPRRRDAKE
jgi:hypothetical protein